MDRAHGDLHPPRHAGRRHAERRRLPRVPADRQRWVHLRMCQQCGHVGCCDSSPNRHATAHYHETAHPMIRSFEPGEEWFWCYVDEVSFYLDVPPGPSHS